jgi:hypothetical protein
MFASTQMGGMNLGFPDVCLTPAPPAPAPVPIPYPNSSVGVMTAPAVYNVLMGYTPSHNMTDPVPASMGDNPGVATGVASGTVMMNTRPVTAAFTVLVNGAPLTRLTTVNIQNSTNCPGGRIAPSQVQVIVLAP